MTLPPPPPLGADPLDSPSRAAPPPPEEYADDPIAGYAPAAPTDAPGLPIGPGEVAIALSAFGDGLALLTRHEHWRIEPAEVELPSAAIARQLAKPDTALAAWLAQHADALLITVGLGVVFVPRAWVEWEWIRYQREERRAGRVQQEAPIGYGYSPEPGAAAGGAAGGPGEPPAGGPGLSEPADRGAGAAAGTPTDPERLAAAVGGVIGT